MTDYKKHMQMTPKAVLWGVICLFSLFVLSGCGQFEKVNTEVAASEKEADRALRTIGPSNQPKTPLRVDNRPWYGSQAVPITNGIPLPASVNQPDSVVMTFGNPVDLFTAAQMIQSVTGIRTVVGNGTIEGSLGNLSDRAFMPSGGEEVSGGRIVWSGRLENLLDQIADTFAAEWNYDGNMIRFAQETTRTFMLHSLANEVSLEGAVGTGQSDTNIPSVDIDGTATLQIWAEISEAVERMIGEQGSASFSPSTGTITVTARPEVVRRVENYLRYQNSMRLRRVAVSVKVLSVNTADNYSYGVDINGLLRQALGRSLSLEGSSTAAGGLNLSILKNPEGGTAGDFASTLAASEEIERVSIVHSGSLVTLSDQPAPLQVGRQISYLERVSSTAGDSGGSVSLEPGTVDVGLFMTVLPRIVEGDRILMRLSVAITDTTQPFREFGAGDVRIQLPEIETTGFLQNAVLNDGETMVIAGFEKSQNAYSDEGTPGGLWTGGRRATNRGRDLSVLLINAQILPEEPLTVIGE